MAQYFMVDGRWISMDEMKKLKAVKKEKVVKNLDNEMLIEARKEYTKKTGNDVPNRFKNDLEWLLSKI